MTKSIQAPPASALINEAFTPGFLARSLWQSNSWTLAPRGRGQRLLVWPGFGASNGSTSVLRTYLRSLGYRVDGWRLGRNGRDVLATLDELKNDLVKHSQEPVTLIGWSLGGYLAREVARDCPELVEHVVTMGSPVVGGPKYTSVAGAFQDGKVSLDEIEQMVDARYAKPLHVPVTALYSKADGVVAWQACIDERSPYVEHVEVVTSHVGFGFDAQVFRIIADRLARRSSVSRHGG